jgi:hypothetical protein
LKHKGKTVPILFLRFPKFFPKPVGREAYPARLGAYAAYLDPSGSGDCWRIRKACHVGARRCLAPAAGLEGPATRNMVLQLRMVIFVPCYGVAELKHAKPGISYEAKLHAILTRDAILVMTRWYSR